MIVFEWEGSSHVPRLPDGVEPLGEAPAIWSAGLSLEGWRRIVLVCLAEYLDNTCDTARAGFIESNKKAANATFCDGVNTGHNVSAFATKRSPTTDGVLDEMRRGIEPM